MNLALSWPAPLLTERYQPWSTKVQSWRAEASVNEHVYDTASLIVCIDDGSWDTASFDAHTIGCNAVSWAPAAIPGSLVQVTGGAPNVNIVNRFASAGCDNLIKIWSWK
jgi:hypothetical protein